MSNKFITAAELFRPPGDRFPTLAPAECPTRYLCPWVLAKTMALSRPMGMGLKGCFQGGGVWEMMEQVSV